MEYCFNDDHGLSFMLRLDPVKEGLKELKISTLPAFSVANGQGASALAVECQKQIQSYLKGELREFSLPLALEGTDFQLKVWKELSQIPYGKTVSYKELAARVGKAKAYQAVGQANGANPIPLVIPCHRVVTHKKGLGGYSLGLKLKKHFLQLEGAELSV